MSDQLAIYFQQTVNANSDDIAKVCTYFKERRLLKNEVLLNAGDVCRNVYFVLEGSMRAYSITEEGHDATRFIAFENTFITTLNSFITQTPSNEFLQGIEPGKLLSISYVDFRELLATTPVFKDLYIRQLEVAYTTNHWRLQSFLKMDARERYDYLMQTNPMLLQRLSNKILASYLGITQESLSRLKARK